MIKRAYDLSPRVIQNIGVSLKGFSNHLVRFNEEYYKHKKFLKSFYMKSFDEKQEFQIKELRKLITHAKNNSSFYSKFYQELSPDTIENIEDLKKVPVLEKEILKENIEDIYIHKEVPSYTGGTTGNSMKVYFTKKNMQQRMAVLDEFKYRTSGFINNKMWKASFTGKTIVPIKDKKSEYPYRVNLPARQLLFSSFHISESNMDFYIKALNKYKPVILDGFYSSILDIARYMNLNNIKLSFKPQGIYPTSETLTEEGVDEIENAFDAPVFNQYASSEGAPFILECDQGTLHIDASTGIIEADENGDMLLTSFSTYGTPLIRYRIGDSIDSIHRKKCACGSETLCVGEIRGRNTNYILNDYGQKITEAHAANFFKEFDNEIYKGKIVHDKKNECYQIYVVKKKNMSSQKIEEKARKILGKQIRVIVVENIPREKSGKYMIVETINT